MWHRAAHLFVREVNARERERAGEERERETAMRGERESREM